MQDPSTPALTVGIVGALTFMAAVLFTGSLLEEEEEEFDDPIVATGYVPAAILYPGVDSEGNTISYCVESSSLRDIELYKVFSIRSAAMSTGPLAV